MDDISNQPNALNYALRSFTDNTCQTVFLTEFPVFKITHGVRYAAEMYAMQWFIIVIFSSQELPCLKEAALQIWDMYRLNNNVVEIEAKNELGEIIFSTLFDDTIFLYDYFQLFWIDGLLLLPTETIAKPNKYFNF